MAKYSIKCDDCQKKIGSTNNMSESVMGGRCKTCKANGGIRF